MIATFIVVMTLGALLGCTNEQVIENARREAYERGRSAGYSAGRAEAYSIAFKKAEKVAYKATVRELYATGEFTRKRNVTAIVLIVAILLGYSLQYAMFYVARVQGVSDIDRIVLPGHLTAIDFTKLNVSETASSTGVHVCWLLGVLLAMLTAAGCTDIAKVQEQAYKEGYQEGLVAGKNDGEQDGMTKGEESGIAAAHVAAANGEAWQLYAVPAWWALGAGAVAGILLQYLILFQCRRSHAMGQLSTTLFVPAVRSSLAYSVFESYRRLTIETESELRKLDASNEIKRARIEAIRDEFAQRMSALKSLEEFRQARLVTLAEQELSNVMSEADLNARQKSGGDLKNGRRREKE